MSKVLKRLYLGDVVKSFGTKQLRKLTTEEPTESIVGTWHINTSFSATAGYGKFAINYTKAYENNKDYTHLCIGYWITTSNASSYKNAVGGYKDTPATNTWTTITGSNSSFIITITGGDDVNNADLLAWLKANATKQ